MPKQNRRAVHGYPMGTPLTLPWAYAAQPKLYSSVASLWEGLMDILTPNLMDVPLVYFRSNDAAALNSDVQAVLKDAQQAHQKLLLTYPQLMQ